MLLISEFGFCDLFCCWVAGGVWCLFGGLLFRAFVGACFVCCLVYLVLRLLCLIVIALCVGLCSVVFNLLFCLFAVLLFSTCALR